MWFRNELSSLAEVSLYKSLRNQTAVTFQKSVTHPKILDARKMTYSKFQPKWSRYRPGVTQRVDRIKTVFFHDRGTRSGWVVSSTPRPYFITGKDPAPILQKVGWAPGSVWTSGKSRPRRDSIPDRPARKQSLYRMNYPAHKFHTKE